MRNGQRSRLDEPLLVREWRPYAYSIAYHFFIPGADVEDVRQEALVGLLAAIRSFDPAKGGTLGGWVGFVVRRHLMTAVTQARALKHGPLNDSVRATAVLHDVEDTISDPHRIVAGRLELARILGALDALTALERRSLVHVVGGGAWVDMNGRWDKQLDNAVARAREKLRAAA